MTPILLAAGAAVLAFAIQFALTASGAGDRLRAQARPNNASMTPQTGGLAVIPAALLFLPAVSTLDLSGFVFAACVLAMFLLGLADDLAPMRAAVKFALHWAAALAYVALADLPRFDSGLPGILEAVILAGIVVWFVNMTNFMDGMDWMTVTGFGIPLACIVLALTTVAGSQTATVGLGLTLAGALAGFAPFNLPPARAYLGDSGALALGFAGGALVAETAAQIGPAAALLPFSYYLADSFSTLALRLKDREPFWRAHQRHAYQAALARGRTPGAIAGQVAGQCAFCGALALGLASGEVTPAFAVPLAAATAVALVAWLRFAPARSLASGSDRR